MEKHEYTNRKGEADERTQAEDGGSSRRSLLKGALAGGTLALSPALADRVAAAGKTASVEFNDQVSNGRKVVTDEVFLPQGGWVSIHDGRFIGDEGEVGIGVRSILGFSEYLSAGKYTDVPVHLFEDPKFNYEPYPKKRLADMQYLIALPHKDTNNNQEWEFYPNETEQDGAFTEGDTTSAFPLNRVTDGAVIVSGDVSVGRADLPLAYELGDH